MWEQFKNSKFAKFFTEKKLKYILIGLSILLVACLITLNRANDNMVKYTEGFARQKAVDSLQVALDISRRKLELKGDSLAEEVLKIKGVDHEYITQLLSEQERIEIYKRQEYEKINNLTNLNSPELQRQYAEFK